MFNKIKHLALAVLASVGVWGQSQTPHKVYPSAAGAAAETRLYTPGGTFVGFKAPATVAADTAFVLPDADGSAGQSLTTDGSGNWVWSTISGSSIPVCTSTTGNDTYTCTISGFTTYAAGYCIVLNVDTANTGTATVNISTVGAKNILGYGGSALSNNDILASVPVIACYDGTDFQLPPGATSSGAFLNGGNTFGADATLGLNDLYNLNIETDNTVRWRVSGTGMLEPGADDTYDIGELTNRRVRGVYSKFVDTATAGGTGDSVQTRKLQLFDNTGSTSVASFWDFNAVASGVGAFADSYMYVRDPGGTKVFQAERVRSGVAVDRTYWYTDLLPDTNGGQNLGNSSYRWNDVYLNTLFVNNTVISDLTPSPNNTNNLGNASLRWAYLWAQNAHIYSQVTIGSTSTAYTRLGQILNTNTSADFGGAALNTWSATGSHASVLDFNKSTSSTIGTHATVANGDMLGFIVFRGSDGTAFQRGAEIASEVDAAVSSGIVPGRLRFRTANTSGTMVERWRINSEGHFLAGTDNSWDIGASGASRPRNVYVAGNATLGGLIIPTGAVNNYVWTTDGSGVGSWQATQACATCFVNGGNTFGAAATLGTNDANILNFETDNTTRWKITATGMLQPGAADTYDIGDLSSARVRGVYAQLVDTAKSGGTGDYIQTRKLQLADQGGATAFWHMVASGTTGTSGLFIKDNSGSRWISGYRALASSPTNDAFVYTNWIPAARSIAGGDAVNDGTRPNLGSLTDRWLYVFGNTVDTNNLTVRTGAVSGYVLTSDGSGNASWATVPSGLPVVDTTAVVKGSVDATKLLRFEVDGFTTATTRVLTPQNASYTLAGTDLSQTFGNTQTFTNGIEFASSTGSKLMMYSSGASNKYELAVASGAVRLIKDYSTSKISFGYGSSASYTEQVYIDGSRFSVGNLNIYSSSGSVVVEGDLEPQTGGGYDLGNLLRWGNAKITTLDVSSTASFGGSITANGGIVTGSSTNSTIYVGSGNMYLRTFSGGDANCSGVTDGWVGIRTDTNEIQVCIGGATKKGALI